MPDPPPELSEPCQPLPELTDPTMKGMLENHVEVAGMYYEECARRSAIVGLFSRSDASAVRQ